MRGIVIALLAGLLAATAPSASALCMADAEGGCGRLQNALDLDIDTDCADGAPLCVIDRNETLAGPNESDWDIVVHNHGSSAITLEFRAIGFYDKDGEPVVDRTASQLLASLDVPAGQNSSVSDVYVPGNVSHVRVQALAQDPDREAELDAQLSNIRIMMMQPGDGPVDDGAGQEPASDLDDHAPAAGSSKDSPALALPLLAVGCLVAVLAARRLK
ncbi:MAG: hypothetical protein QOJ26_40 [Thermoplasmata archaeon]|jgi:hypothetical protein|nr:hypothetical protein [Thermoplasmata archaeon]